MSMYRPMRSEYQIDMHGPLNPLPVISGAAHKKEGLGHLMRSLLYIDLTTLWYKFSKEHQLF